MLKKLGGWNDSFRSCSTRFHKPSIFDISAWNMKKILYLLMLLSLPNIAIASSFILYGIVKGHIADKPTGKAIENANVIVLETSYGTITDKSGFF